MCGFAGFIDCSSGRSRESLRGELERMSSALVHRGPDDSGVWVDEAAGAGLAFRRLSILDLSAAGHQPMQSGSGRYVIAFNGEVYNYERIRRDLTTPPGGWRGHSDTEVILAAVEAWGLTAAVQRFIGMFAFALWDRQERTVSLVRDRVGVKPLYYGWSRDQLLFGSELKSLRAHSAFAGEVDRDAVALLLKYGYIPAPHTIHRDFRKVMPGTIVTVRAADPRSVTSSVYWSASAAARAGQADLVTDDAAATGALDEILRDSVGLRMIADVPVGVFLSGGIDSTLVTALMQSQSTKPVRSFTIGFHEGEYDEATHAAAVARHLGTDHTELFLTTRQAQDVIPLLPSMYDEPFGDSSQIPTYLVSSLARRDVTVVLSGDGGDELFAGYNRHRWAEQIARVSRRLPSGVAGVAAASLRSASAPSSVVGRMFESVIPASRRPRLLRDKLRKIGLLLADGSSGDAYATLVSQIGDATDVVVGASAVPTLLDDPAARGALSSAGNRMMLLDLLTYLPDDILTKVDRASMAISLEAREPLLDHRLIEYAWRLPFSMKVRQGKTKWILREILHRYVPHELVDRPKMGFSIPLDLWLRAGLRDWAEALLDESRLRNEGFLQPQRIRVMWDDHISGRADRQHQLWNVLMFQAWLEAQRKVQPQARATDAVAAS